MAKEHRVPPPPRMFPRTEGQAKVMTIMFVAVLLAAFAYGVLRGLGLTQLFRD